MELSDEDDDSSNDSSYNDEELRNPTYEKVKSQSQKYLVYSQILNLNWLITDLCSLINYT